MTNEELIDQVRLAGVQRGLNASLQAVREEIQLHAKGSSGRQNLERVLTILERLDAKEVDND